MRSSQWLSLISTSCLALAMANSNLHAVCGSSTGAPTDNPVATKYGSSTYSWTSNLKWGCIFNINNYSGSSMVARFNAARDAASAEGGGVVFFPAGTYNFTDSISLKNGVIIRGANPSINDGKSSSFNPPSKLYFPKYNQSLSGSGTANTTAFKRITTAATTDSNIGVVNVDVNRGSIRVAGNVGVLAFGVRSNNSAEPDPGVPASYQNAWQRWSYRFNYNINITGTRDVLAANNRINDAITDNYDQPNYKIMNGTSIVTLTAGSQAKFSYTDHYGLGARCAETATGVVVRDNWVFHTMRVALYAKGNGLVIRDNIVRDQSGKAHYVDPTGLRLVGNATTLENRAIDWAGANITVSNNNCQVYRHRLKDGPYYSVDGEGILLQACCGGTLANGATINNNNINAYIGLWKTKDINNVLITSNTVQNGTGEDLGVYVDANVAAKTSLFKCVNVRVTSNTCYNSIDMWGDVAGSGNVIQNNNNPSANSRINHSCAAAVSISGNTGFVVNACRAQ